SRGAGPAGAGKGPEMGGPRCLPPPPPGAPGRQTAAATDAPIPDLTRRERDVLEALCAPLLSHNVVREPATTKEIAAALVVTEAAVRQHLIRLYDKFGIYDEDSRRRSALAREALRRGVLSSR